MEIESGKEVPKKKIPTWQIAAFGITSLLLVAAVVVVLATITITPEPPSAPPPTPPPMPVPPAASPGAVLPILGHFIGAYGTALTITEDYWFSIASWGAGASAINSYGEGYLIMQNPKDDAYNPSLWSKVNFHDVTTAGFAYCTTVYNAPTATDALLMGGPAMYDPTNANGGCGLSGFSHSTMTKYDMPLAGTWLDDWGYFHTFTNDYWFSFSNYNEIKAYGADMAVYKTSPTAYNPNTWSKVRYHKVGATSYGYCTTAYGEDNVTMALAAPEVYNSSDASGGCGSSGFSHSVLSPYAMPLAGSWTDNWGGSWTVTDTKWGANDIVMYTDSMVIYKTPATASYSPNTYTKIQWHTYDAGSGDAIPGGIGYCTTAWAQPTAAAAMAYAGEKYNSSDASGGCGNSGYSHSVGTPVTTGRL